MIHHAAFCGIPKSWVLFGPAQKVVGLGGSVTRLCRMEGTEGSDTSPEATGVSEHALQYRAAKLDV